MKTRLLDSQPMDDGGGGEGINEIRLGVLEARCDHFSPCQVFIYFHFYLSPRRLATETKNQCLGSIPNNIGQMWIIGLD